MKTINLIISILFLLVAVGIVILAYSDYHDAFANRRTFEMVHGVPVEQYVKRDFVLAGAGFVGILIGVFRFVDRKRERLWQTIVITLVITGCCLFVIGTIKWAANGFDH